MLFININDKLSISGGVEVYLSLLNRHGHSKGMKFAWWGVSLTSPDNYEIQLSNEHKELLKKEDLALFLKRKFKELQATGFNVHSISDSFLIQKLAEIGPVVRFMHEPRMICPGQGKFWRFSEKPCTKPFGMHCLIHSYTEGCANRHPKRLLKAWNNTFFETKNASHLYEKIVVMSDYMKTESLNVGIREDQIEVIPYFTEPSKTEVNLRTKFDAKKLIFIGRLIEHKGPHRMIEYLAPLFEEDHELSLDIIGDGALKPLLQEQVAKLGLEKRINFIGWLSNDRIHEKLSESSLLLFTSLYPEAFGIVGIEAMLHHTPVVAFDVGGVSTWLDDNESGFLVDADDANSFRKCTKDLLNDFTVYSRMAMNGRKEVEERFLPSSHLSKLNNLYHSVLKVGIQ